MHIRRIIRQDEIYDILKAFHDGPCNGHFTDYRTRHKILQMGYYWPTLFKDAKKLSRHVIAAKEWVALASPMRCPYTHN